MSRRSVLRWGVAGSAGLALGGCSLGGTAGTQSQGPAKPPAKPTGVLRVASVEPKTFDPTLANDQGELGIISNNVYEGLLRFKGDTLDLEGLLAESFESSDDAREWVFKLKDGVEFHDGEPLTSTAVRKSLEYYDQEDIAWPFLVPADADYDDSDPTQLRITSKEPFPDLARNVAFIRMVSPKLLAAGKDEIGSRAVGTGPFRFVSYKTAKNAVLEANDAYHGDGPYLERIEYQIIPDPGARVAALQSGSVDIVTKVAPADAVPLRSDDSIAVLEKRLWSQSQVLFFTNSPPANNLKIRQAIAHAIDKKALVKSILRGMGEVHDSVVPPDVYGYQSPRTQYPFDLAEAKRLVGESGLSTPIEMETIWAPELGASVEQMQQAISAMVKKVGIDLKVTQKPLGQIGKQIFDTEFKTPYQAAAGDLGWLTGGPLVFGRKYIQTVTRMDDPAFNRLNDKMLRTPDGKERLRQLAELQEMLAQQLPLIPLYAVVGIDAHKKSVRGYVKPKDGFMPNFGPVYLSE